MLESRNHVEQSKTFGYFGEAKIKLVKPIRKTELVNEFRSTIRRSTLKNIEIPKFSKIKTRKPDCEIDE